MSTLPCETDDEEARDVHGEINRLEDELAPHLDGFRAYLLADVLRAVLDHNGNPTAKTALMKFLEV